MAKSAGVYSATYSGVPVYEFQFGADLKEHVMRRRQDDWVNATHILKAAGFDKPARTRILEREVQKDVHEKIQGGYGKYQGTWIPLGSGEALAHRNNIYERLRPIFEFTPGAQSPPPAPRHASKPKAARKPAVPKWGPPPPAVEYEHAEAAVVEDDDTADNVTIASASYMGDEDRYEGLVSAPVSHPPRKRKREDNNTLEMIETQHCLYGDELLDYFLLSRNSQPAARPEPPPNYQPNWVIDREAHTALHWASAMGDVEIIRQLKYFNASLTAKNARGETPLMRAVNFSNCFEKETFSQVLSELYSTIGAVDNAGCTVFHHAVFNKSGRHTTQSSARYYLETMLNKLHESHDANSIQRLLDSQDVDGNTALHLAAHRGASKCIRTLLGHQASPHIANKVDVQAAELIEGLNMSKQERNVQQQRSSSPFAPPAGSQHRTSFRDGGDAKDALKDTHRLFTNRYRSAAANAVQARLRALLADKFEDLAHNFEDELAEKEEAEAEARRILAMTQHELDMVNEQTEALEAQLESEAAAQRASVDVGRLGFHVLNLVSRQNWVQLQQEVDDEVARTASRGGNINGNSVPDGGHDDNTAGASTEERIALARQLSDMIAGYRQSEADYVDALSNVGTGDRIEKYRRLLTLCLGQDADHLDENLENLIEMMEEQQAAPALDDDAMSME